MLTHKGTQTIETEKLTLRRFEIADAQAMFDNWANDERVTRFLTWTPHGSAESSKQLLESWCAAYENESTYNWAIEFEGKVIGNISVVRFNEKHEYAGSAMKAPDANAISKQTGRFWIWWIMRY